MTVGLLSLQRLNHRLRTLIILTRELAQIAHAIESDSEGGIRTGSRFVSWERLDHFDGIVLRVHTTDEGVRGDFGSISIVLALLWALFTAMLLISWLVIRRMVSNMYSMQNSLQWQAGTTL